METLVVKLHVNYMITQKHLCLSRT